MTTAKQKIAMKGMKKEDYHFFSRKYKINENKLKELRENFERNRPVEQQKFKANEFEMSVKLERLKSLSSSRRNSSSMEKTGPTVTCTSSADSPSVGTNGRRQSRTMVAKILSTHDARVHHEPDDTFTTLLRFLRLPSTYDAELPPTQREYMKMMGRRQSSPEGLNDLQMEIEHYIDKIRQMFSEDELGVMFVTFMGKRPYTTILHDKLESVFSEMAVDNPLVQKKLIALELVLEKIQTDKEKTSFTAVDALNCRYLRLGKATVKELEESCRKLGIEPGLHAHSEGGQLNIVEEVFADLPKFSVHSKPPRHQVPGHNSKPRSRKPELMSEVSPHRGLKNSSSTAMAHDIKHQSRHFLSNTSSPYKRI